MKVIIFLFICVIRVTLGEVLPIPPLLEREEGVFHLKVVEGKHEFFQGIEEETLGYNGDILGPTLRVRKGDEVEIHVKNTLEDETTVHWHGLRVISAMDGGPHQVIPPGATWKVRFPIEQGAATLWYHPHLLHRTGPQVYRGLAGLLIIEDERSEALKLPRDYGVDDIPLIIQDRRFNSKGRLEYLTRPEDIIDGMLGDTGVVNGVLAPTFSPRLGVTRFRILNGANARTFYLRFSDNRTFYQIATDGGFLEKPVGRRELILSPGERAEIIVNFTSSDKDLQLRDGDYTLLTFMPGREPGEVEKLPKELVKGAESIDTSKLKRRYFVMQGTGRSVNINGKQMDMRRIDEYVKLGETEVWVVTNSSHHMGMGMMMGGQMGMMGNIPHPFHIHNTQFRILSRNGLPPSRWERGDKDTVLVSPGESIELLVEFRHVGLYMYHCHILEHEDMGMMGQFNVSR
ncbi:multicopper oxidase mco [Propionigenium maris DSM 9537]|uniref:Multicopper oxidase mco n=1 Tax=Propionigenium maris DSM 9537 TaxID=1123000 RepID=A0A9W6GJI8_9FUSO|nr:multicopper oxidase domain-containing protein [Propionigenium maris]GLI55315.1 multicopper oxidase mco [Propionigenium maris DSM 9537]